ncbi:MAG: DUF3526 domain-containing protein [Pseudomonadota bacterium]
MFRFHFAREWNQLWKDPLRAGALALYAVLAVWALMDGLQWRSHTVAILSETPADLLTEREEWFADLREAEDGGEISPYAARPMSLTFFAPHPPGELGALAHRSESVQPHTALISGWRSEASLFQRYEVEGPAALRAGRLDLLFVVTVLLPLFLLMLTYDVLIRERSSGRFTLFLVQGGNAVALLSARICAVLIPLVLIPCVCVLIATLASGASGLSALAWMMTVLVYAFFWAAIGAFIASVCSKPTTGALAVLASWSVFVVLLPSSAQFLAQAIHPVPSRVAYLSAARDAEGESRRNIATRAEIYMAEHPGQGNASDEAVPGFYRSAYLANIDIRERTTPMVAEFERQQTAQRELVAYAQLLSPTIIAQGALQRLSGTGAERAAAYRRQARKHLSTLHDAIGPATVNRHRLTVAQAEAVPEFRFQMPPAARGTWVGVGWTAFLALGASALVVQRLKRIS